MSSDIAAEIGHALRTIRQQRGVRLKDLPQLSRRRFNPTTVAGYERGEREISLRRFCDLCAVYGIRPERLLGQSLRSVQGRPKVAVDLTKVGRLGPEKAPLLEAFVRRVAARRGQPGTEVVTLRTADLEVLATAVDVPAEELLAEVGIRRPRPR